MNVAADVPGVVRRLGASMRHDRSVGSWGQGGSWEPPVGRQGDFEPSWEASDDSGGTCATLLGISEQERDAIRIIMAAQVRLRLLRLQLTGCLDPDTSHVGRMRRIRQRARLIARARDTLLRSAIHAGHAVVAAR